MYIGEKKIKGTSFDGNGRVKITFKGDVNEIEMNTNLFEQIKLKKEGKGSVTDAVNHLLATKFLLELSAYGLEFYQVEGISMSMKVLVHNLREELFRKTFDCSGAEGISLDKIID